MAESMMGKFDPTRETASGGATRGGAANAPDDRRGFLVRLMAVVIGGLVTIFPFAAGLLVFADPWRRQATGARLVKVATLDDVPDDGIPRRFSVSENQVDAWNYYPNQPVGAVYLRRIAGHATPEALQATCPHAGCMVDFLNSAHVFKCPCHNSSFQPDGQIIQPSPAPRPMDTLVCKVIDRAGVKEIWVEYQNFYTGSADKIAKI
jgi:menaquinol-cytochrome c reductase iron-sulfur subunit